MGYNYIPPRDMEFDGWLANFVNEFVSYAPKLGFSPTEVGTVTKALSDWHTDYKNFLNAQQNLKSLAITKDNYRRNIHSLIRGFVQRLSAHPAMTDDLRQTFRIVPQGTGYTGQGETENVVSVPFSTRETTAPFHWQFRVEPSEGSQTVSSGYSSGTESVGTGWQVTESSSDTGWQPSEPYVTTDGNGNPVEFFQLGGRYYTTGDYIPWRDGEFDGWLANFVSEFITHAPMFGFTASEVSAATKWLNDWRAVYTKFLKAQRDFFHATQAKNACRCNVEGIVHNFVQRLYNSPSMNENILQQFRITTSEGVPWYPSGTYVEIPPISLNLGNLGRINVQFNWEPYFATEGGYGYPIREVQPTAAWSTFQPQPVPAGEAITTPTFQVKSGGRRKARAS